MCRERTEYYWLWNINLNKKTNYKKTGKKICGFLRLRKVVFKNIVDLELAPLIKIYPIVNVSIIERYKDYISRDINYLYT